MMDVLGLAKEIEQQGYEHYLSLADSTPVREISGIFKLLAREEKRHFEIFDAIKKNDPVPPSEDLEMLEFAKKTFESLTAQFKTAGVPAISNNKALEKALEMENNSVKFYTEMLNGKEVDNESNKATILYVIAQERMHAHLVSSLLEFHRHPGEWLENAEWNHLDDY